MVVVLIAFLCVLVMNGVFPVQVDVTSLLPIHVEPLLVAQLSAQVTHRFHEVHTEFPSSESESCLLSVLHYAVYCKDVPQTVIKALILNELADQFEKEGK